MMVKTVAVAAACLGLAAQAIIIPSTVSMPELTPGYLNRKPEAPSSEDAVQALPIPDDWIEKMKDLNLGVSKPLPFAYHHLASHSVHDHAEDVHFGDDDDDDFEYYDYEHDDDFWSDYDEDDDEDVFDFDEFMGDNPDITIEWDFGDDEDTRGSFVSHGNMFDDEEEDIDDDGDHVEWIQFEPVGDVKGSGCPTGSSLEAMFCRIRSKISTKFEEVKPYFTTHRRPCPKKLAQMAKAKAAEFGLPKIHGGPAKFWNKFHPDEKMPSRFDNHHEHHRHHQHHGYHHHMSKFSRILRGICSGIRTFITGFLIPILIGVAAGMTASLVGMCVGTALAWLWIKFVRGGKRGNAKSIAADEIPGVHGEKEGLLELDAEATEVEAPPVYIERQ